jgi:GSH-dependent disulfide-bond oxidoreductase
MDLLQAALPPRRDFVGTKKEADFQMLKFYFNGAPNPNKVALFLEESGLPYELVPVDTRKGEQFKPEFLKVNPNGKVPAIDDDGVFVFDSNAILLYLAEKTGKFLPQNSPTNRAQMLSWLMFIATGLGPYSGQAVHFKHFSPKDLEYAHNRYQFEANRHYKILDDHLAKRRYMVGDIYTIVDIAFWGWAVRARRRCLHEISERQAAGRRGLGKAGGSARDRVEGQVHLQDRDGRGGQELHVRPPQDQGGLTPAPSFRGTHHARAPESFSHSIRRSSSQPRLAKGRARPFARPANVG